ncbi:ilvB operon leader peptide IvbL [Pectobacterium polaris]|nr:ilvB operon leader peptide IvbL [Pectobacterium polaris]
MTHYTSSTSALLHTAHVDAVVVVRVVVVGSAP